MGVKTCLSLLVISIVLELGVYGQDVNGCDPNPCNVNAECTDVPAPGTGAYCTCNSGYEGDGYTCADIDGCAGDPCNANAACADVPAPGTGEECTCNAGYEGDGYTCTDIDGCDPNPCDENAQCTDLPAPATGQVCTCNPGYEGNGYICTLSLAGCARPQDYPPCIEAICPPPPYNNGDTCGYRCALNCTGPFSTEVTCIDGIWVGQLPVCKMGCDDPPSHPCTDIICSAPYNNGDTCGYTCAPGCYGVSIVWTCIDGIWDGLLPDCQEGCLPPPNPPCTKRFGCDPPYTYGESCYYRCHNEGGYAMEVSGDPIRTCQGNGLWSGMDLICDCKDPKDCCRPDIIFVLDYSGSMDGDILPVKVFVGELVERFDIGDPDARVGVLRYDNNQMLEFHLNAYNNKPVTLAHINGMTETADGRTNTGAALTYVANTMLSIGNRPDAPDVVIVLTDGVSTDDVVGPASVLHSMGVQTFAIGVGDCLDDAELHEIANCEDHVYKLADFNGLDGITDNIHKQICCDEQKYVVGFIYHGCFRDSPNRKFPYSLLWDPQAMTKALCLDHCKNEGFAYGATQFSSQCFCGTQQNFDNLGPQLPDSQCNRPCTGDPNEMCGGRWKMSVYSSYVEPCCPRPATLAPGSTGDTYEVVKYRLSPPVQCDEPDEEIPPEVPQGPQIPAHARGKLANARRRG